MAGMTLVAIFVAVLVGVGSLVWWLRQQGSGKNVPPGTMGYPVIGELIEYVVEPMAFIKKRFDLHGPVFKTNIFFRPTILVGGPAAISAFLKVERKCSASSLPYTFQALHGEYSTLVMPTGPKLSSARKGLIRALAQMQDQFFTDADAAATTYLANTVPGNQPLMACVHSFLFPLMSQFFLAKPLPKKYEELFMVYNTGLLGLVPYDLPFTAFGQGMRAREQLLAYLVAEMPDKPDESSFLGMFEGATDEKDQPYSKERLANIQLLFVWGAYYEALIQLSDCLWALGNNPDVLAKAREEIDRELATTDGQLDRQSIKNYVYVEAISKEVLRLYPPSGGGMRVMDEDVEVLGHTFPKGWVVSVDPRITCHMADVFEEPSKFKPERFLPGAPAMPSGAFTPGGAGTHYCPGLPTGVLISKVFLIHFLKNLDFTFQGQPEFIMLPFRQIKPDFQISISKRAAH